MIRLRTLAPRVADALEKSSAARQRAAAAAACQFAVLQTGVRDPIVQQALHSLLTTGGLEPTLRAGIEALVARLDNAYFDLQEAADGRLPGDDDSLRLFGQARAVAAILFASGSDPFEA